MPTKKKSAATSKGKTSRVKPEDEKDLSRYMTEENRIVAEAVLAKLDKPARKKKAA